MKETVEQRTQIVNGKEYSVTITRQRGLQEIEVRGERRLVESVTILESALGRTFCYTPARPKASPEETERNRRHLQEVCAQALRDQGLW